jgi:hypothetical protein
MASSFIGSIKRIIYIFLFTSNVLFSTVLYANDYITLFDEDFTVSLFTNYNMCSFSDSNASKYETDKPFDIGFGFRYKKFSAQVSIPLSFDEQFNIWSYDFEVDSYFNSVYYEAYFKSYPDLYIKDSNKSGGLSIHSSGLMATFLQNNENHSLSSVIKLDKKQNKSSGSLLYGFGIFHSSLYSTDQTLERFRNKQHLLYLGPSIGYSYTWVFKNDIFLNLSLVYFSNIGLNINTNNCLFIPQLEPKIVIGYHNETWSINLKLMNHAKFIVWNKDDLDILTLVSITAMFSKRF